MNYMIMGSFEGRKGDDDLAQKQVVSAMQIEHVAPSYTPEEERKLVRKVDFALLPMMWLMYLLSYMDRTKYARRFYNGLVRLCLHIFILIP